jgi:hypothetical protein
VVIARPLFASRQTFIGARLECYVNWGYGFVTWAEEKECTNANTFSPVAKDDSSSGWRVMVRDDCGRQGVHGWDVGRRPLR